MRGNEKQFKETRLIIVLLAVIIILLFGIIILLLARGDNKAPIPESNRVEKKDNAEVKEEVKEENESPSETAYEEKTYEIDISKDCEGTTKCIKSYDFSLKNNNHVLKIYNISTATFDHLSYFTIDDKKIETLDGFELINKYAIIDSNILAISGTRSSGDYISIIYFDSNLNKKTEITGKNYKDNQILTSKKNNYTTCEVKTCDDQTKRFYSYILNDDATIESTLEKTEEHTFCSAEC